MSIVIDFDKARDLLNSFSGEAESLIKDSLDDGKFEVVYLNHAKATICSFTETPVVIEF